MENESNKEDDDWTREVLARSMDKKTVRVIRVPRVITVGPRGQEELARSIPDGFSLVSCPFRLDRCKPSCVALLHDQMNGKVSCAAIGSGLELGTMD